MVAAGLLQHPFKEAYAAKLGALPGATTAWVDALRQSARAVINTVGLPGPKNEAWKFTALGDLAKIPFSPASAVAEVHVSTVPETVPLIPGAARIVMVNGRFVPALSDAVAAPGVRVDAVRQLLAKDPASLKSVLGGLASSGALPLVALNTAYMADGLAIHAAKNAPPAVFHVISIHAADAEPVAFHPRHVVTLEAGAHLTLIETHIGRAGHSYLANPVTEISIGANAILRRYVSVQESDNAFHLATTSVALASSGTFEAFHMGLGGGKVRQDVHAVFNGPGASATLNGVYALSGTQHHDFTTAMDHLVPHTTSSQVFKGVVDGASHGVYQGRVLVAKDAQKTDARQLHKAVFLSKGPAVDCKPELEIFADDVQCAHGATTGELDPAHLFYLRARGIDEATARGLLVAGFLDDAISSMTHEAVREAFSIMVHDWLGRHATRRAA